MRCSAAVAAFVLAGLFATCAGAEDQPAQQPAVAAPFSNAGLGSQWVTLERYGKTLNRLVDADALICSTQGGTLEIALVPTRDTSHAHWSLRIPAGQCRCAPRPGLLLVQNSGGGEGDFAGTLKWTRAGKCPKSASAPPPSPPLTLTPGAAEKQTASCQPLAAPGGYYTASCQIAVPLLSIWTRICIDSGWVVLNDGASFANGAPFPQRFARLITDENLLQVNVAENELDNDLRWSFIANGCIDLFHVSKAWVVLHGDATYDTAKVKEIAYTVARLKPSIF